MARGRVVVRTATVRDAPALARVYRDAYGPVTVRDVRTWMRLPETRREYLVAVVDGVVASTVNIQYRELLVDGVPIRTGGIAGVATHGAYRRRGLATRLMREAIHRIRARGISNTTLFTGYDLPAIRIYRRLGYTETAGWRAFHDARRPVDWIRTRFDFRGKWLRSASFGRPILRDAVPRVLLAAPGWRATVACDGRRFTVHAGRRGRPDVVMRGRSDAILHCFGDPDTYDRYVRRGTVRVEGDADALRAWRRVLTAGWRG